MPSYLISRADYFFNFLLLEQILNSLHSVVVAPRFGKYFLFSVFDSLKAFPKAKSNAMSKIKLFPPPATQHSALALRASAQQMTKDPW